MMGLNAQTQAETQTQPQAQQAQAEAQKQAEAEAEALLRKEPTYNDIVRRNTVSLYVNGGISNYLNFRGGSVTGVQSSIAPDISLGLKYNIKPWVRVGLNLGYTKIKAKNAGIDSTRTVTPGYQVGEYKDAILTVDKAVLVNRNDNHLALADLGIDFNILELAQNRNQIWNLWLGFGVGYMHGWNRNTVTTAIREEAVASGSDHFNIYNKDYIITDATTGNISSLYIPVRLSVECDVSPRWALGLKGEYKYMPLDKDFTPKGIWSANFTIAYSFVRKRYNKKSIKEHYEGIITDMSKDINSLKDEVSTLASKNKAIVKRNEKLENKTDAAIEALKARREARQAMENGAKSKANIEQIQDLSTIVQILADNTYSKVYIKGYSSADGKTEYSKKLADLRAKDIAEILIENYNISPDRVITNVGLGAGRLYKVYEYRRVAAITIEIL